jgi:hypothetical protein
MSACRQAYSLSACRDPCGLFLTSACLRPLTFSPVLPATILTACYTVLHSTILTAFSTVLIATMLTVFSTVLLATMLTVCSTVLLATMLTACSLVLSAAIRTACYTLQFYLPTSSLPFLNVCLLPSSLPVKQACQLQSLLYYIFYRKSTSFVFCCVKRYQTIFRLLFRFTKQYEMILHVVCFTKNVKFRELKPISHRFITSRTKVLGEKRNPNTW